MDIGFEKDAWEYYKPIIRAGKLCYFLCSKSSVLPIRDVLNDHSRGEKKEPNIESGTYNKYRDCNKGSVTATVKDGLSHVLFITKYVGRKEVYRDRYFIVGYYEIGRISNKNGKTAIQARKMCFVPIEKAYEVTDDRWKKINIKGDTSSLKNLRYATQRITGDLLDEIINHLDKGNALDDFTQEVERLMSKHNHKKNRTCHRSPHSC